MLVLKMLDGVLTAFIASAKLTDRLADACIYPEILGSDHCPVGLTLKANKKR